MRAWCASSILLTLAYGCSASSVCGPGLEEQDGQCIPVCTEACGAHEKCNVDLNGGTAECQCVAGYAGEPCEWTGGLVNPGFSSAGSWNESKGATVSPLAAGLTDPGIASFESIVLCDAGAVSQVVEMPAYEDAEPFLIEVTHRRDGGAGVEVGYGRAFRYLTTDRLGWKTSQICLGEAGYGDHGSGGPVNFQIAASERLANCFTGPIGSFAVDRFEILVAEEGKCPAPGTVLNGDANVDDEGWTFDVQRSGTGASTASLEPGVGASGSDGARLYKPAGGDNFVGMYTKLSVPVPDEQNPSPALRFWWKGAKEWNYRVHLGSYLTLRSYNRRFDVLFGDDEEQTATYCLPPWTHGNVVELAFTLSGINFEDEAELVVDDIEIISDPRCGNATDLLDPGFDSAPNRWPGSDVLERANAVTVLNDPARAHPSDGAGFLELRYGNNDASVQAEHWIWIPPAEGNRGPQLVFHSNVPADPGVLVAWVLGIAASVQDVQNALECEAEFCPAVQLRQELPNGLGWRRNTVCLPPEWTERWYRFRVAIVPTGDPLEVFDPPRTVLLDDFEVRLDEGCPTGAE